MLNTLNEAERDMVMVGSGYLHLRRSPAGLIEHVSRLDPLKMHTQVEVVDGKKKTTFFYCGLPLLATNLLVLKTDGDHDVTTAYGVPKWGLDAAEAVALSMKKRG